MFATKYRLVAGSRNRRDGTIEDTSSRMEGHDSHVPSRSTPVVAAKLRTWNWSGGFAPVKRPCET